MSATRRIDTLVVGGGPAGLATAIAARAQGLEVEVLDRFHPPIDKPCGEGILPAGLAALESLGVGRVQLGGREIRGVRYLDAASGVVAEGGFAPRPGLGVRRTTLHQALAHRAAEAGARLSWGLFAEGLSSAEDGTWVVDTPDGPIEARWVVGADGLASHARRWAGLEGRPARGRRRRYGVRRHYQVAPWTDHVEVHWTHGCEAYVTPVGEDLVGVAMLWGGSREGFDRHLAKFPALERRLHGAPAVSRDRGCGPFLQRASGVVRGTLALVGDAAGYVDALTGEGLGHAFREARALAEALAAGDLALYQAAHRRIVAGPDRLTRATLLLTRHPGLRRRVLRALAHDPRLFARLLQVQNGDASFAGAAVPALAKLGVRASLQVR
ncbi:MAG TPA: NAD(P)/FAD-dependent oxidoreductase [Thermoanaerobaculia bacterium]|nr:NAD(P)/FAD-dependent oxidoreductase [Thermoanaerobaculia bacterium]